MFCLPSLGQVVQIHCFRFLLVFCLASGGSGLFIGPGMTHRMSGWSGRLSDAIEYRPLLLFSFLPGSFCSHFNQFPARVVLFITELFAMLSPRRASVN